MTVWEIGLYVNSVILEDKSAEYGKRIVSELSTQSVSANGQSFSERNVYWMMQFASVSQTRDFVDAVVKIESVAFHRTAALKPKEA